MYMYIQSFKDLLTSGGVDSGGHRSGSFGEWSCEYCVTEVVVPSLKLERVALRDFTKSSSLFSKPSDCSGKRPRWYSHTWCIRTFVRTWNQSHSSLLFKYMLLWDYIFLSVEALVVRLHYVSKPWYHMCIVLCTFANMFLFIFLSHWAVVDSFVSLEAVSCCSFIVWGSWLAVKRSIPVLRAGHLCLLKCLLLVYRYVHVHSLFCLYRFPFLLVHVYM